MNNALALIKREHAKWSHGKITVVQFAYNVEEILNDAGGGSDDTDIQS